MRDVEITVDKSRRVSVSLVGLVVMLSGMALATPAASAQSSFECSFVAGIEGFDVSWSSLSTAGRFVVERRPFDRFWWRGRTGGTETVFHDTTSPKNAATMAYRVTAKDGNGQIVASADCSALDSPGFTCSSTQRSDRTFLIEWHSSLGSPRNDIVASRQVDANAPYHWRFATKAVWTVDGISPTGAATYRAVLRLDRRIVGMTSCEQVGPLLPPLADCSSVPTELPLAECEVMDDLNQLGLGEDVTTDPCIWPGVVCEQGHVTEISFRERSLSGSITPRIASLSELRLLDLSRNQLTGGFPIGMTTLTHLTSLLLSDNSLSGHIPSEVGNLVQITSLDLTHNSFTGPIPPEYGNLVNLDSVALGDNRLTGSIPPELGNLKRAFGFVLYDNRLTGSIPPELGGLSGTYYFNIDKNQLSGEIPPELGNMSNAAAMTMSHNQLTGSIPAELANLNHLYLNDNQLTGSVPAEFANLEIIWIMFVNNNQLSGDITEVMSVLRHQLHQVRLVVQPGEKNCFFVTDPDVAAWLTTKDADWDSCP